MYILRLGNWKSQPVAWARLKNAHRVVARSSLRVVGFDDVQVYLNDPAFANAPQMVLWDSFLAAWAEYDETAILIQV